MMLTHEFQVLRALSKTSALDELDKYISSPANLRTIVDGNASQDVETHVEMQQPAVFNDEEKSLESGHSSEFAHRLQSSNSLLLFPSMTQTMRHLMPKSGSFESHLQHDNMSSSSDALTATKVHGVFRDRPITVVFCPAPIKTVARMREKLAEYAGGVWPLSGYILDPIRCSIICDNPADILDVVCPTCAPT